jgi:hypothetical protein
MVDYKAIQKFLTEKNLHVFTFYTKADKPVKAVIRYLSCSTSADDIIVALQEIDYDVISIKQTTAERPTPEGGGVTHTSLTLFLVTLARNQKAPEIFKLTILCNIVIKVEAYRSQNGLAQCYSCSVLATSGCTAGSLLAANVSAQRNRTQTVSQPAAIATSKTVNRRTQQVTEAAVVQNKSYRAEGTCGRQHRDQQGEDSSQNTQHPIDYSALLFAAPISSIGSSHRNKINNLLQENNTHQETIQTSGQSVQAKTVNINATDMFLAFTVVQQIMTVLSGAATEKENVAVITKAAFRLLKNTANSSS